MEELRAERKIVKDELDKLRVLAWVYEDDAGAQPRSPQETYREEIKKSDLFIGLFWQGYGKYTIEEYEYAGDLGKDRLIYAKESGANRQQELQTFLDSIGGGVRSAVTINRFGTAEELREAVKDDVDRWRAGRVRESQTAKEDIAGEAPSLVEYVDRPAIITVDQRAYELIREADKLMEEERYAQACQEYLRAVLIAMNGLESEYDGILAEARYCWVSDRSQMRRLLHRIKQYLSVTKLKNNLDDAKTGLSQCREAIAKPESRFFRHRKADPKQVRAVSQGLEQVDDFISNLYMEGLQHRESETGVGIKALFEIRGYLSGENPSSNGLRELVERLEQDETKDRLSDHTERIREAITDIGAAFK
jgi:Domain of unknown function (DUF4062)